MAINVTYFIACALDSDDQKSTEGGCRNKEE